MSSKLCRLSSKITARRTRWNRSARFSIRWRAMDCVQPSSAAGTSALSARSSMENGSAVGEFHPAPVCCMPEMERQEIRRFQKVHRPAAPEKIFYRLMGGKGVRKFREAVSGTFQFAVQRGEPEILAPARADVVDDIEEGIPPGDPEYRKRSERKRQHRPLAGRRLLLRRRIAGQAGESLPSRRARPAPARDPAGHPRRKFLSCPSTADRNGSNWVSGTR